MIWNDYTFSYQSRDSCPYGKTPAGPWKQTARYPLLAKT